MIHTISQEMQARIQAELDRVARDNRVSIVLAVESGSRAWGFPSLDSDYDVRFLYLRPRDAYLSVFAGPDVIDHALDAVFDVNGWDVRKALALIAGSNPVVLEWLTSPIRYRAAGGVAAQLLELTQQVAHLPAFAYHYDRLARRSFGEIDGAGTVRLKDYCYALRAALALAWIREQGSTPPMDLPCLLEGVSVTSDARDAIAALVRRKADSTEKDVVARIADLDRLIGGILAEPEARPQPIERADVRARIDRLFVEIATGQA